ncbi:MAG: thiol peroxidase [Actinomycetota bacterium]|nr:thiol peroxidase [Actinomycetota bacterium]
MTEERTGEAFEQGEQLTIIGRRLQTGEKAPEFLLDHFDGEQVRSVRLADSTGQVRLINTVNSLDTPVCDIETRHWDGLGADLPEGVVLYTVSMDLPFAQDRWRTATSTGHDLLTAHKNEGFGRDYGVLIKEWRLLQRAVFVIDPEGTLAHAEYVSDQMAQPDYQAASDAARAARTSPLPVRPMGGFR